MAPMRATPCVASASPPPAVAGGRCCSVRARTTTPRSRRRPTGEGDGVALEISLGPGAGDMTTEARDDLQNDVGDVLSTYVVEGFLGDYPRDDFVDVLDTFTSGGAQRAAAGHREDHRQRDSKTAEEVVATRLQASISTFAPDGKPRA